MLGGCMRSFWTSWAILSLASGGPLHRYPRESEDYQNDLSVYANYTANEVCFSEGEVFQKGDVMPNPGPCEECRCEPPSIVCNMLKCPVNNNGCRTIQRANHCCPDYNCECDYNGQLYNDGERLELPEEPCQVCYCKGGEVMCNSITCYHRDDCDPIEVAGQCCPKYENCPVRDMGSSSFDDKNVLVRSANKTNHVSPKREMNPWLLTKVPSVSSSSPPKSPQDATTEGGNVIIVSDWLTERRSTTEDATREESGSTDGPDLLTDSEHLTTAVRPNFSMDGEIAVKNYHTDAPLDEVIFTRIDGQKENQEVIVDGPTSVSTEVIDEKVTTRDLVSETTPSTKGNTVDVKVTENPFLIHNLNEDFNERNTSLNTPIKQISSEVNAEETAIKDKEHFNNFEEVEVNEKNIKLVVSTEIYPGINISEESSTNSDFITSTLNMDSLKKNLEYDVLSNTSSENVTKLDILSQGKIEQETTVNSITGSYNTEKLETVTEIDEVTNNLFEDQTKEDHMLDKLELDVNRVDTTEGPLAISTNSAIGNDVTPISIEVNLEREKVDNHVPEIPKMKEETYKDSNKSEMVISTPVDQKKDAIIRDQLFFTNTTTTMSSPTSSSETKIKRNNFNSSKHEIGDMASMNINKSAILEATHHTRIISEDNLELHNNTFNQTSNSSVSETLIIGTDKTIPPTPVTLDEVSDDSKELVSDAPPVLELNSHVPFLQLGGHGNVDPVLNAFEGTHQPSTYTSGSGVEEEYFTSLTSKIPEDSLPAKQVILAENKTEHDEIVHASVQESKENVDERELGDTETTTDITSTTSHIPLTPGDLKALAEYLINDTIKTVEVKNSSDYTPNQWLKGNLTSEENMSSILSAANISINIMSKEDNKVRKYMPETVTKISEATRLDKYEQDKHSSGNSLMNNLKLVNKTGFIRGKNHGYLDSPKINSEPEKPLNDEAKGDVTTIRTNSESLNNIKDSPPKSTITSLNKPAIQQNNLDKNNAQHLNPAPQSVDRLNDPDITTENNHRFDNVNPIDKAEIDKSTQNKIRRSDKLLEITATSFLSLDLTTTSSPVKQATR